MKIAIAGTGYVRLSIVVLPAQKNTVYVVDIIKDKVAVIIKQKSLTVDKENEEYLATKELDSHATIDVKEVYISRIGCFFYSDEL